MLITEFYEDSEIFITGGSGVVGKGLIEKLLRSCNVKRIYLLMRSKKNLSIAERLEQLRKDRFFKLLREKRPNAFDKVSAVPGDILLPNLGITSEYAKQMENVKIIFHCAATIRFDEDLHMAIKMNVGGTLAALKLAETLKNLKSFVHVSTYFSNPYLKWVEPKLYQPPLDWRFCLNLVEKEERNQNMDYLTKKIITGFPNTYTFTKNIAESLANDYRDRVPVCIYRPSIIAFPTREPEAGFPATLMGFVGLFVLSCAGLIKVAYLHPKTRLDITPQDVGTKTLIYYGKKSAEVYDKGKPEVAPIYICSSIQIEKEPFATMIKVVNRNNLYRKSAFTKCLLIPGCVTTDSRVLYKIRVFIQQIIPALIGDFLLKLFGRKQIIMSILRKSYLSLEVMQPFMFNNFDSPGFTDYDELMKETTGTDFDIKNDMIAVATEKGRMRNRLQMMLSSRSIILNEDPSTLGMAQRILDIKIFILRALGLYILYLLLRVAYNCYFKDLF